MNTHLKSIIYMGIAGVLLWQFMPERFAVNMPVQMANSLSEEEALSRLTIDDGFKLSVFSDNISGARALITTDTDDLIVSRPNQGIVTLLFKDENNDGLSDGTKLLLEGLNRPHGLALHNGWLYIAETNAVLRIQYNSKERKFIGTPRYLMRDKFPGGGNHWARSIRIGPDERMYVSVGSSCNACIEDTPRHAAILQFDLDGNNGSVFASGLRNTTGFDWQPSTNNMYGLDIGRDFLGDDLPPEELNLIQQGQHYGWPFEYGNNVVDTSFGGIPPTGTKFMPANYELPAHTSPLSLLFIQHNEQLKGSALITLHGSWNRSKKAGYSVVKITFGDNNAIEHTSFITGFEKDETVIGRPVDLTEDKHGNIYLSDDYNGKIYKISSI